MGQSRDRISTGIQGLDAVLDGGLLPRGVYMLIGRPGTGKTILASQLSFHHASQGGRVVYVTMLSETHERMIFNLEPMSYFDASLLGDRITLLSGYGTLEEGGLDGLAASLRQETRRRTATLLVVDGLVAIEAAAKSRGEFKKLVHELQTQANLLGCTVVLLSTTAYEPPGAEHTMVDGVIELSDRRLSQRTERELEVKKYRGSSFLRGAHAFNVTENGVALHPRLESLYQEPSPEDVFKTVRVGTGIAGLDAAMHGGILSPSSTVLFGPTGTGKTAIGLHFLCESSEDAPGLHFGFYETPPRILLKATRLGLDLRSLTEKGIVEMVWRAPTERVLDALGHGLLELVRKRRVKRLFVDGIDAFLSAAGSPERITPFMTALSHELRLLGVTTLYTLEIPALFRRELDLPLRGISALVENIWLMRFSETARRLHRTLTIVKCRDSGYDSAVRELLITHEGVALGDPLPSSTKPRGGGR